MGATIYSSLQLYIILFLMALSVLFLGQHSFGYSSEDFQSVPYTFMTIFKMMIGRLVGVHY